MMELTSFQRQQKSDEMNLIQLVGLLQKYQKVEFLTFTSDNRSVYIIF